MSDTPPRLPQQVSPDGREIWDWAARLGQWRQREVRIAELRAEIARRARECGSCRFWMCGRDCPREGHANGRPKGPSMKAPICGKYEMQSHDVKLQAERQAELDAMLAERERQS